MIWDLSFFTLLYLQLLGVVKQCHALKLKLLSEGGKVKLQGKCGMFLDAPRIKIWYPNIPLERASGIVFGSFVDRWLA